jgi:DNA-binding transcriptional MerR regulator
MSTTHRLPILRRGVPGAPPSQPVAEPVTDDDDKLLRVGDLARAAGKTVRAIHHYENVGLLKPHKRSKGRYRLYAPEAVARLAWIGKLHDLGMTLGEIQNILAMWEQASSAPEAMAEIRAVYDAKLDEVRSQIERLSSLERELKASVSYLDTCDVCDPGELVAACSSCTVHDSRDPEPGLVAGLYAGQGIAASGSAARADAISSATGSDGAG